MHLGPKTINIHVNKAQDNYNMFNRFMFWKKSPKVLTATKKNQALEIRRDELLSQIEEWEAGEAVFGGSSYPPPGIYESYRELSSKLQIVIQQINILKSRQKIIYMHSMERLHHQTLKVITKEYNVPSVLIDEISQFIGPNITDNFTI